MPLPQAAHAAPAARSLRWLRPPALLALYASAFIASAADIAHASALDPCDHGLRAQPSSYEAALCYFENASATGDWEGAARRVAVRRVEQPRNDWLVLVAAYLQTSLGDDGADTTYRDAVARFARAHNLRGELLARGSRSLLLSRQGRPAEAAGEVSRVAALGARTGDVELRIRALTVEARYLVDTGHNLTRALRLLEQARSMLRLTHPYRLRLQIGTDLASLAYWFGHYDEAIEQYQQVEHAAREQGDQEGVALALVGVASSRYGAAMEAPRAGDYERVAALAAAAAAAARAARSANLELAATSLTAELHLLRSPALAAAAVARCFVLAARMNEPGARGECGWLQARVLAAAAKPGSSPGAAAADAAMQRAISWQIDSGDEQRLAYAWRQWMRLRDQGDLEDAERALGAIEALRALQRGDAGRSALSAAWSRDYYWLSGRLFARAAGERDMGGERALYARAFAVIERMRARALLESLARDEAPRPQSRVVSAAERHLLNARISTNRAILASRDAAQRRALEARLARIERERDELLDGLAGSDTQAASPAPEVSSGVLWDIRQALAADEALLSFQIAPDRDVAGEGAGGSWLLVVSRAAVRAFALPERVRVNDLVSLYLGAFGTSSAEAAAGQRLYADLLGGALSRIDPHVSHLIVVADEPLHRLPWAALRRSRADEVVGARYAFTLAPSATLWLRWRQQQHVAFASPAAVFASPSVVDSAWANPTVRADSALAPADDGRATDKAGSILRSVALSALPLAAAEGEDVVSRLGAASALYVGADASEAALRGLERGDYAILHFAAHAVADELNPRRAAIVLATNDADDGLLQADEIAALPLHGRLVVLSTCISAAGASLRGEGVMSLARSFFAGGARTVVGSLWRVRDDAARAFFVPFYRELADGARVDAALQVAQLELRDAGYGPAAWAAFQVYGDGALRPITASPKRFWENGWLLPAAVSMVGLIAIFTIVRWRLRGVALQTRMR